MEAPGNDTTAKLIARAVDCATASLAMYSEDKIDRFGLEGGVALELLCKAFLSRIDRSLIVDTKSPKAFDYLLLARGLSGATVPSGSLRTIGAEEAVRRVAQLLPNLTGYPDQLRTLLESRNGFVHLGEVDGKTTKKVFARYVNAIRIIGEALGLDFAALFGPYEEFARRTIETSAEDVRARVAGMMAKAKQQFQTRYGHLAQNIRMAMIELAEQSITLLKYEQERVSCPACEHLAVVTGDYDVGEWQINSYDREGEPDDWYLPVTLHASSLNCPVCGLRLETAEELQIAGLEPEVDIEEVDPSDFHDPYDDSDPLDLR